MMSWLIDESTDRTILIANDLFYKFFKKKINALHNLKIAVHLINLCFQVLVWQNMTFRV